MTPTPLIVPPVLFEQIKNDQRWAARCERGDIQPNRPIPTGRENNR